MARQPWEIQQESPRASGAGRPDPPVSKGLGYLVVTEGPKLEILTRTNRPIVKAIEAGTVFVMRYRSVYIQRRVEQLERLGVSEGGLGRDELIRMIEAGGKLPDSYYQMEAPKAPVYDYPVEEDRWGS